MSHVEDNAVTTDRLVNTVFIHGANVSDSYVDDLGRLHITIAFDEPVDPDPVDPDSEVPE